MPGNSTKPASPNGYSSIVKTEGAETVVRDALVPSEPFNGTLPAAAAPLRGDRVGHISQGRVWKGTTGSQF